MKTNSILLITCLIIFFSSCSRKRHYTVYQNDSKNTGTIVIKPVKKTKKTFVTIDDKLIIDSRKVKSITIKNVPVGQHTIQYSSDNSWYKYPMDSTFKVTVDTSKTVTKIVKNPPYSTGYYIYISTVFIGSIIYSIFMF